MNDLVMARKELESHMKYTREIIAQNIPKPPRKHLRLLPIESKFLYVWKKYNKNKKQNHKEFLKSSVSYLEVYLEWRKRADRLEKFLVPIRNKTIRLLRKINKLEKKYEKSSEILQEIRKLKEKTNPTWEKFISIGIKFRKILQKTKLPRKNYLRMWKKFSTNSERYQIEFLKSSSEFAKILQLGNMEYGKYEALQKKPDFKKIMRVQKKIRLLEDKLK